MTSTTIIRKWNATDQRIGFFMVSSAVPVLNNCYMGQTRFEAAKGICEINERREKLGLDSLEWNWAC